MSNRERGEKEIDVVAERVSGRSKDLRYKKYKNNYKHVRWKGKRELMFVFGCGLYLGNTDIFR